MKWLMVSGSLAFALALACGSGESETPTEEPDVVVVPVPEGDDDGKRKGKDEHWCCQYEDADGKQHYALTDGKAACTNEFGDRNGSWTSGNECTPCCCKAPNDPDDASKGKNFELTTAVACSAVGECLVADADQCKSGKGRREKTKATPTPTPRPRSGPAPNERRTRPR